MTEYRQLTEEETARYMECAKKMREDGYNNRQIAMSLRRPLTEIGLWFMWMDMAETKKKETVS